MKVFKLKTIGTDIVIATFIKFISDVIFAWMPTENRWIFIVQKKKQ